MEEDTFYDSLEEEPYIGTSSAFGTSLNIQQPQNEPIDKLVPFYTGYVNKADVDSVKIEEPKKPKKKKCLPRIPEQQRKRSYLTMFYERHNRVQNDSNVDMLSSLSPNSFCSCGNDATSCYFDDCDCEKLYENPETNFESPREAEFNQSAVCPNNSLCTLKPNRNSSKNLHEINIKMNPSEMLRMKTSRIGDLGGLGPQLEQNKLELLRRRQSYGQMASQKNIIKMKEVRAVQNLKREIKKSSDLCLT